jgi:hypothetical protein
LTLDGVSVKDKDTSRESTADEVFNPIVDMKPLSPVTLIVPGLVVTAYACEMNISGSSGAAGAGFTHQEDWWSEDRGTFAQYSSATLKPITGYHVLTECGGAPTLVGLISANTTKMVKTQTLNAFSYNSILSQVQESEGAGFAKSRWSDI